MRVAVSGPALDLIASRGGRLYVRVEQGRCCGRPSRLATAHEPPDAGAYVPYAADLGFVLLLPAGLSRLPDELQVDVQRFPSRVEAYWDGCAWIT